MLDRFFNKFRRKVSQPSDTVQPDGVPYHVAIIMDGNGRWARKRGLPRVAGHRSGMKVVKEITTAANDIGVRALTLYAFSTENWKRPSQEVDFLMRLPQEFLEMELENLHEKNVRVQILGDQTPLPNHTKRALAHTVEYTKKNKGLLLNIALNYGSRVEIIEAVKKMMTQVDKGNITIADIDENLMDQYLLTAGIPDPDLLIRTSGEVRLSNFLLWQSAYTEFWFTDILWPDFTREHFFSAIRAYQKRGRRFGGLK